MNDVKPEINRHTGRMPVIFVGHGSPMNAIEDNTYTRHLAAWAKTLPRPKAILAVSAHWLTPGSTQIDAQPQPPTIHDFGGFPQALFDVQYPAAGAEGLAQTTLALLQKQLPHVTLSRDWGLDHGSWSVLCHMYPDADIPVFQLSINYAESGAYHYAIGQQLAALREQGVLIFASGNITHNLRALDFQAAESKKASRAWAQEFDDAVWNALLSRNDATLIDYASLSPAAKMAVPSPDHYWPLLYILGAADPDEVVQQTYQSFQAGTISMRCLQFGG